MFLDGFSFDDERQVLVRNVNPVRIFENAYEYPIDTNPIKLNNCFDIYPQAKPGNSGCPIIDNNIIYGMNISGFVDNDYLNGKSLRSDYIQNIISESNK